MKKENENEWWALDNVIKIGITKNVKEGISENWLISFLLLLMMLLFMRVTRGRWENLIAFQWQHAIYVAKKGGGGNKNKSARQVRKWKSTFKEKKIHWIEWWWNFALKKSSFLLFSHKKSTTLTFYVQTFTYMYQWIFIYEKIQSATRK